MGNEETDQLGEGEDDISDTDLKVNLEPGDTLTRFALVLSGTPLNYDEIFEDIVRSGVYSEKDLDSSNAVGVLTETHVRNVLKRFSQSNAVIMDPISAGDETDNFRFAKPDGNLLAERKNPEDVTHLIAAEYDLVFEADGRLNVAEIKGSARQKSKGIRDKRSVKSALKHSYINEKFVPLKELRPNDPSFGYMVVRVRDSIRDPEKSSTPFEVNEGNAVIVSLPLTQEELQTNASELQARLSQAHTNKKP